MSGAEGQSRTDTGLPRPVFETGASTIPPLRHASYSIAKSECLVALLERRWLDHPNEHGYKDPFLPRHRHGPLSH